jgi:hypothetical protein
MSTTNTADRFLNNLLVQNGISPRALLSCVSQNSDVLDSISDIFDIRNSMDAKLMLTLPYLFDADTAEDVISYFRKEQAGNSFVETAEPDVEGSKLLLLSAFVYNPSFFAMAWNWCSYVQYKAQHFHKPNTIATKRRSAFTHKFTPARRIVYMAAAEVGFREFGEKTEIPDIGTLTQLGDEAGGTYYIQFKLSITSDSLPRPFIMTVEFTTLKDGQSHNIQIIDNPEKPDASIVRSVPVESDYTGGIEIHSVELHQTGDNG